MIKSTTWLILDVSYLCHRAFHTTGGLTHKDIPTGVIYGFLRDVVGLCEQHDTPNVVFCFDREDNKRKKVLPEYKSTRHADKTPDEIKARKELLRQIKNLRIDYLPRIGFSNILSEIGYEADDIIASVCLNSIGPDDEAIIVSADEDLFQLLSGQVRIWNPHKGKAYTLQAFTRDYGITPRQWARVKAIAGCRGDDVPGVAGVGDKTAAKYLRGECRPDSKAFIDIEKWKRRTKQNMRLVRLPFEGTPVFELAPDRFSIKGWRSVIEDLGMRSLGRTDTAIFTGRVRGLGLR
jgi:DNA polymerase-1